MIAPPLIQRIIYDGWDFGFKFKFIDGVSKVLRRPEFKAWYVRTKGHPAYGYWRIPRQTIDTRLEEMIQALSAVVGDQASTEIEPLYDMLRHARSCPNVSWFTHDVKLRIYPLGEAQVAISGTYHPGVIALAKSMNGRYLSAMTAWRIPNATALLAKNNLLEYLKLSDEQVELFDGQYGEVEGASTGIKPNDVGIEVGTQPQPGEGEPKQAPDDAESQVYLAVTKALSATPLDMADLRARMGRYDLLKHQQEGVMHLVRATSALLADDMGLGKSRQAAVAADLLALAGEQILIVCPATLVLNWANEVRIIAPDATIAIQQYKPDVRWIITNYEQLEAILPHAAKIKVMVIDEAHSLKEPTSQRTRLAFDVASRVMYRLMLTGTPILNREVEIHTLLRLSGHEIGMMALSEFKKQFAGDTNFRVHLNKQIQAWMLRRTKDEVLKHLKGKQRQFVSVQATPEFYDQYRETLQSSELIGLKKISRLRALLEEMKLDCIVQMISELQGDDKVIVFTEFKKTIKVLTERLAQLGIKSVSLTGDDSTIKRQKAVDTFQQDPDVRVFIGTTMAAGVGITLTAANYVMFASLPWTPALLEQAEDRAYRLGQQRLVIVKIPQVDQTIDSLLWNLLKHKKTVATEVISPADVAAELAKMDLTLPPAVTRFEGQAVAYA